MDTYFGYTNEQWKQAQEQVREALIQQARHQSTITYSDLCRQVTAIQISPHDYALPHLLGAVSRQEHAKGRGLITILVVYKNGEYEPGPGFYKLAEELGYDCADRLRFWSDHLKLVYGQWANDN